MTHYFTNNPQQKVQEYTYTYKIQSRNYEFYSASGIFSVKHVDYASDVLINEAIVQANQKILDLGCGNGIIGCSTKIKHPEIDLTLADVNSNAIKVARKNVKHLKIDAKTITSDIFDNIPDTFDVILTNPPYVAGRAVCFAFIEQSFAHLNKGGNLQLVARHSKGGKILSEKMEEIFGNVETVAKQGGFRVYKSVKKKN